MTKTLQLADVFTKSSSGAAGYRGLRGRLSLGIIEEAAMVAWLPED